MEAIPVKTPVQTKLALAVLALSSFLAIPAMAHHSFAAEYDAKQPIKLNGTISKVEMVNPHGWIYVDVKTPAGTVEHWACETGAPNALIRRGWTRDSLKPGDVIIVDGFRAKDGSTTMNARSVTFPNGKSVFAGSSDDGAPPAPAPKP
jgi:hypothetical protein